MIVWDRHEKARDWINSERQTEKEYEIWSIVWLLFQEHWKAIKEISADEDKACLAFYKDHSHCIVEIEIEMKTQTKNLTFALSLTMPWINMTVDIVHIYRNQ